MNAYRTLIAATVAIAASLASATVHAHGAQTTGTGATETVVVEPLLYANPGYSRGIYSYPDASPVVASAHPLVIYVDQAYGQAIYSYPQRGEVEVLYVSSL